MYVFICMRPIIRGRLDGPLYGRLRAAQTSVLVRALQEEEELRLLRQGGVLGGGGCGRRSLGRGSRAPPLAALRRDLGRELGNVRKQMQVNMITREHLKSEYENKLVII